MTSNFSNFKDAHGFDTCAFYNIHLTPSYIFLQHALDMS